MYKRQAFAGVYDAFNEDADYDSLFRYVCGVLRAHGVEAVSYTHLRQKSHLQLLRQKPGRSGADDHGAGCEHLQRVHRAVPLAADVYKRQVLNKVFFENAWCFWKRTF